MKDMRRWIVIVPAVVLLGLLGWLFFTRGTMEQLAFLRKNAGGAQNGLVDQRPYQTAQTLSALAVSGEEQSFAQQAERLSDHEVDQAFAQALRMASLQQRVLTGDAKVLAGRVDELKGLVKDDQARVDALGAAAKTSGVAAAEGDDLDVAKAQLGLDQDELTDASGDLARESGDRRPEIQQELSAQAAPAAVAASEGPKKAKKVKGAPDDGATAAATASEPAGPSPSPEAAKKKKKRSRQAPEDGSSAAEQAADVQAVAAAADASKSLDKRKKKRKAEDAPSPVPVPEADVQPNETASAAGASSEVPAQQKKEKKKKKLKPAAAPDDGAVKAAALAAAADAVQAEEHVNGGLKNSAEAK